MKYEKTKEAILLAPLPVKTKRYGVIPHSVFINEIAEELDKSGYSIFNESYLTSNEYEVMQGRMVINDRSDIEIMPSLNFINSYNGTRKASIRCSATVLVCKNGMMAMTTNGYVCRKHIGDNAIKDFRTGMVHAIEGVEKEFARLRTNRDEMRAIGINKTVVSQLIGDMYINESLITDTQVSLLKKELTLTENFKGDSLWDLYNNTTQILKTNSNPMDYDRQHIKLHTYISDKFELTGHTGLYK